MSVPRVIVAESQFTEGRRLYIEAARDASTYFAVCLPHGPRHTVALTAEETKRVARELAQVVLGGAPLEVSCIDVWKDDFGVVWGYLTDWLNTGKGLVRLFAPPRVLCVLSVRRAAKQLGQKTCWRNYCARAAEAALRESAGVYRSEKL